MVKFTVQHLGEHTIANMVVSGPFKEIVMQMAGVFLAGFTEPPESDMDYNFAEYIINMSNGQGKIIEYQPNPPSTIQ